MNGNLSLDSSSTVSDVFYVERLSEEGIPIRNNTPAVLNSTELSAAMETETITNSSVASPEPQIVTIHSDSNEHTFPCGFGNQHPIMPPSLKDLNLPHNPFNVLVTMAVIQQDEDYNPQSPQIRLQSLLHQWNWAPLKAARHCTQPRMTINLIPRVSLDGSFGMLLLVKLSTPMSPDKYHPSWARPPRRRLHEDERENWA